MAGSRRLSAPWPRKIKAWTNWLAAIAQYREQFRRERGAPGTKRSSTGSAGFSRSPEKLFLERAMSGAEGEAALEALAREVAGRRKDPYAAVRELLSRAERAPEKRMKLGDLEFWLLTDGTFRLDGGAMFGVIPRPMWERVAPPDERNRILMAMNSLLIRAAGKWILVETGAGDKWDAKRTDIYAFEGTPRLPDKLVDARRAAGKNRHRHQHASAFRSLRLEHAHREWGSDSRISQCALHRPARRTRACQSAHRSRPRQLFPENFVPMEKSGQWSTARRRRGNCSRRGIDSRAGTQRRHDVRAADAAAARRFSLPRI